MAASRFLNARLENTPLPSTNDKLFVGTPKVKGNVLLEYHVPTLPGLTASFDYQFTGPRAGDDTNPSPWPATTCSTSAPATP